MSKINRRIDLLMSSAFGTSNPVDLCSSFTHYHSSSKVDKLNNSGYMSSQGNLRSSLKKVNGSNLSFDKRTISGFENSNKRRNPATDNEGKIKKKLRIIGKTINVKNIPNGGFRNRPVVQLNTQYLFDYSPKTIVGTFSPTNRVLVTGRVKKDINQKEKSHIIKSKPLVQVSEQRRKGNLLSILESRDDRDYNQFMKEMNSVKSWL